MGLGEYENSHQLQALNSASICYSKGDVDGAIGYVRSFAELIGVEMPPVPSIYGLAASMQIRTKSAYYFKTLALVNRALRSKVIQIRKDLKGPMVRVVAQ